MNADALAGLHRALALLGCASSDWRHRGPSAGSAPLHWPAAIGAAKAHVAFALAELGDPRVLEAMTARMREHQRAEVPHVPSVARASGELRP